MKPLGVHAVHEFPGAEQMLRATFEHVDNDPDSTQHALATPVSSPPIPCPRAGCRGSSGTFSYLISSARKA